MPEYVAEEIGIWIANQLLNIGAEAAASWVANNALIVGSAVITAGTMSYSAAQARAAEAAARSAYNAAQIDRLQNISSAVANRRLVMGRTRIGGTIFFRKSTGTNKQTLVVCIALAGGELDGVEQYYCNDVAVTVDGSGNVLTAPWNITKTESVTEYVTASPMTLAHTPIAGTLGVFKNGGTLDNLNQTVSYSLVGTTLTTSADDIGATIQYQYYSQVSTLNIRFYSGTSTQTADSRMMTLFPSEWTSAHRARGVAYIIAEGTYNEISFQSGFPNITALVRGEKIYDPRSSTTAFTSNPALQMRHVYQHPNFGAKTISAAEDARFIAAANVCQDEGVTSTNYTQTTEANLLSNARALSLWSTTTCTVTENFAITDPEGSQLAEKIVANTANSSVYQTISCLANTAYTFKIQLKADAPMTVAIVLTDPGGYSSFSCNVTTNWLEFTLTRTTTATTGTSITASIGGLSTFTTSQVLYAFDGRLTGTVIAAHALYRSALVADYGTPAATLFDDLVQAMAGRWAFAGGELFVKAGSYTAPVLTLTDSDVAMRGVDPNGSESSRQINLTVHTARREKFNVVNPRIYDDAQNYQQTDVPPLRATDLMIRDGTSGVPNELPKGLTLSAVGYVPQALHIAGIMLRDSRKARTISVPFKLRAYPIELFDTVALTLTNYGFSSKTFMVLRREWNEQGDILLTMKETDAAITTMDAAFTTSPVQTVTSVNDAWSLPLVTSLAATSGWSTTTGNADGSAINKIKVTWTAISDVSVQSNGNIEIQYRSADSTSAWQRVMVAGDQTQVFIENIADNNYYVLRARCINQTTVGQWCQQIFHLAVGRGAVVFDYDDYADGWNTTGSMYRVGDILEAASTYTWATMPAATWAAWTSWTQWPQNGNYTSFNRDLGGVITNATIAVTVLDQTGLDTVNGVYQKTANTEAGLAGASYYPVGTPFTGRWIQLYVPFVGALGPVLRKFKYRVTAPLKTEKFSALDISSLPAVCLITAGDSRIPLSKTYSKITLCQVAIADTRQGIWSWHVLDLNISPGPRVQFRLDGVLTTPQSVDVYIEGF